MFYFFYKNKVFILNQQIYLYICKMNYYTAIEFAKKRKVSKEAVYAAISRNDIRAIKIGRQWFIEKTCDFKFQKRKYKDCKSVS